MVMKKLIALLLLSCIAMTPVIAGAELSGNLNFSTGAFFSGGTPRWVSSALARVSLATLGSSSVKGALSASYRIQSQGTSSGFSLEKAYVRFRLPWFGDSTLKMTVGKSPVSWGYGTYFNAGDIVFGAVPNDISGGVQSGEYRTSTAWMVLASLPLHEGVSADVVALPDLDALVGGGVAGRLGGRFTWNPGWTPLDALEFGYLGSVDGASHAVYAAFDGTLWFDYNLSVSTTIVPTQAIASAKDNFKLSLGLSKVFNIPTDTRYMPFALRLEGLYAPFATTFSGFFSMDVGISDSIGAGAVLLCDVPSSAIACTLTAFLTCSYRPVAGLTLGLQGGVVASKTVEWDVSGALMFTCRYSF